MGEMVFRTTRAAGRQGFKTSWLAVFPFLLSRIVIRGGCSCWCKIGLPKDENGGVVRGQIRL